MGIVLVASCAALVVATIEETDEVDFGRSTSGHNLFDLTALGRPCPGGLGVLSRHLHPLLLHEQSSRPLEGLPAEERSALFRLHHTEAGSGTAPSVQWDANC